MTVVPAKKAGIVKDAQVLKINGKDVRDYLLPELRKMLKQVGENIELVLYAEWC